MVDGLCGSYRNRYWKRKNIQWHFDSWFWKFQPMVIRLVTWSLWRHDSCMAAEYVMRYFLFKASRKQGQRGKRRLDLITVIFSFHSQRSKLSYRSILLTVLPPLNSTTQGPSRYSWALGNVSDLKDIRCNSTISSHAWQFVRDDPQGWPQLQFFCSIIIISCWMTSYFTISGLK